VTGEKPAENGTSNQSEEKRNGADSSEKAKADVGAAAAVDLPMEVKVKLRKFERLESTYTG